MTYAQRKILCVALNRCIQRGCYARPCAESLLCEPHWKRHNAVQNRTKKIRRAARRRQQVMAAVYQSDSD